MRYHLLPVRMAIIKRTKNNKSSCEFREKRILVYCCEIINWCSHYRKRRSMEDPQKIKNRPPISSSNSTSGNIPRGNKNIHSKNISVSPMFFVALFTIVKMWVTSVPINGWMDKRSWIHNRRSNYLQRTVPTDTLRRHMRVPTTSSTTLDIISHFNFSSFF